MPGNDIARRSRRRGSRGGGGPQASRGWRRDPLASSANGRLHAQLGIVPEDEECIAGRPLGGDALQDGEASGTVGRVRAPMRVGGEGQAKRACLRGDETLSRVDEPRSAQGLRKGMGLRDDEAEDRGGCSKGEGARGRGRDGQRRGRPREPGPELRQRAEGKDEGEQAEAGNGHVGGLSPSPILQGPSCPRARRARQRERQRRPRRRTR